MHIFPWFSELTSEQPFATPQIKGLGIFISWLKLQNNHWDWFGLHYFLQARMRRNNQLQLFCKAPVFFMEYCTAFCTHLKSENYTKTIVVLRNICYKIEFKLSIIFSSFLQDLFTRETFYFRLIFYDLSRQSRTVHTGMTPPRVSEKKAKIFCRKIWDKKGFHRFQSYRNGG